MDEEKNRFSIDKKILSGAVREMMDCKNNDALINLEGVDNIANNIKTSLKNGISDDEMEFKYKYRKKAFGMNKFPQIRRYPFYKIFLNNLKDPILILLIIVSVILIIFDVGFSFAKFLYGLPVDKGEVPFYLKWVEGFCVLIAVGIVGGFSSINDYQTLLKNRDWEEGELIDVSVIRGGKSKNISIDDILVGDLVVLQTGDKVPADGILIKGYDLSTNESSVTGETDMVKKNEDNPVILAGTEVCEGYGTMLVFAVGLESEWGKTLEACEEYPINEKTPMNLKLNRLGRVIVFYLFFFAVLTLVVLLIGYFISKFVKKEWSPYFFPHLNCANKTLTDNEKETKYYNCGSIGGDIINVLRFIIIAVSVVFVLVPDSLQLEISMNLFYSVNQMLKDNILVRKLFALEKIGEISSLIFDKTGLNVVRTWICEKDFTITDPPTKMDLQDNVYNLIVEGISVNSNAELVPKIDNTKSAIYRRRKKYILDCLENQFSVRGNKIEGALLLFVKNQLKDDYKRVRELFESEYKIIKKFSFSGKTKRMSCIVQKGSSRRLFCKGAAEMILYLCSSYMNKEGKIVPLSENKRNVIVETIFEYASKGLRTLSLAYKDLDENYCDLSPDSMQRNDLECELCLYQIVGIKDPPRKVAIDSVNKCKRAGIFVRMVSGDNVNTCKMIARECGILTHGYVIEGPDFRNLNDDELNELIPKLQVMARACPTDKLLLIKKLQEKGHSVASTGDGTGDGPQLIASDVGLAMNIGGTEVAKAASDIVILDDNISTIVKAILWGRSCNESIRKFLQFQLCGVFVSLSLIVICAFTHFVPIFDPLSGKLLEIGIPITVIQLLWVHYIISTLESLSLATKRPVDDLLNRKPYLKTDSLINWKMWASIISQFFYQLIVLLFMNYCGLYIIEFQLLSYGYFKTASYDFNNYHYQLLPENTIFRPFVFNTFVFLQLGNSFNCRKINLEWNIFRNLFKNYLFFAVFLIIIFIQICIVEIGAWSGGYMVFRTTGLEWWHFLISFGFGVMGILVHFVKTAILRIFCIFFDSAKKGGEKDEENFVKMNDYSKIGEVITI